MITPPYQNAQGQWILDLPDGTRQVFATQQAAYSVWETLIMDEIYQNFIKRVAAQARLLRESEANSQELDVLYTGAPSYTTIITQAMIDAVPEFKAAGLTKAMLDATVYTLKMCNAQMDTIDFPAFIVMANI